MERPPRGRDKHVIGRRYSELPAFLAVEVLFHRQLSRRYGSPVGDFKEFNG
jgi:hypothetical protein